MTKVVIDMSMSLDGFVAGPDDGKANETGNDHEEITTPFAIHLFYFFHGRTIFQ